MALRDIWRKITQKVYDWLHPDEESEGIAKARTTPVEHKPLPAKPKVHTPEISAYERAGLEDKPVKRVEPRRAVISPVVSEGLLAPDAPSEREYATFAETVEKIRQQKTAEQRWQEQDEKERSHAEAQAREAARREGEIQEAHRRAEEEAKRIAAEQETARLTRETAERRKQEQAEKERIYAEAQAREAARREEEKKAAEKRAKIAQQKARERAERERREQEVAARRRAEIERQEAERRAQQEAQRLAEEKRRAEEIADANLKNLEDKFWESYHRAQNKQWRPKKYDEPLPEASFYKPFEFEPTKLVYTTETAVKDVDKLAGNYLDIPTMPGESEESATQYELLAREKNKFEGPTVLRVTQEKRTRTQRTKQEELDYINQLQDQYITELAQIIADTDNSIFKETNLTSPTGTGKTKMMIKLINAHPEWFFVITTPSHGQLHKQIEKNIQRECKAGNFKVYGVSSLTATSKLKADDVLKALPKKKPVVWLRDEGHRKSNNWMAALEKVCYKIVNISATNIHHDGVVCNFSDTMMLRTVQQHNGTPEDTLNELIAIKKVHQHIQGYNPCALFRLVSNKAEAEILQLCEQKGLKALSLINFDDYDMSEICEDDNDIDVLLYRQKLDMGIDIRRAHVIYIENSPNNASTVIQSIGRCRRNAMFWRTDVDILAPTNKTLLLNTRQCHVFFGNQDLSVETDENGELCNAFCPYISVQKLRPDSTVLVQDGVMSNGLLLIELVGCSGEYHVTVDPNTGFNVVDNPAFYKTEILAQSQLDAANAKRLAYLQKLQNSENGIALLEQLCTVNKDAKIRYAPKEGTKGYRFEFPIFHPKKQMTQTLGLAFPPDRLEWFVLSHKWKVSQFNVDPREVLDMLHNNHEKCAKLTAKLNDEDIVTIEPYIVSRREAKLALSGVELEHTMLSQMACELTSDDNPSMSSKIEPYQFIFNNRELSIIGAEMYAYRKNKGWMPNTSVTTLLSSNTKFRQFIVKKYQTVLEMVEPLLTSGKNEFDFDKKQNSCLGFCVEYFAKAQMFHNFLPDKYDLDTEEGQAQCLRACIDMYKTWVAHTFGAGATRIVSCPSVETLGSDGYEKWRHTCIDLGHQTAKACMSLLKWTKMQQMKYEPSFISKHVSGLADILTKDTILDIKVMNRIEMSMILQVLAYHYLSTLRNSLAVDRVAVYDASSNIAIVITGLRTGNYKVEKVDFGVSAAKQYETAPVKTKKAKPHAKADITDFLDVNDVVYIDRRKQGGALWVIGGPKLEPLMQECALRGTRFKFKPEGGNATQGRPGWWTN